jgi:hypothetical protein
MSVDEEVTKPKKKSFAMLALAMSLMCFNPVPQTNHSELAKISEDFENEIQVKLGSMNLAGESVALSSQ